MKKLKLLLFAFAAFAAHALQAQIVEGDEQLYLVTPRAHITGYLQNTQKDAPAFVKPWAKGDFFVGVNSDILGIGWQNLSLSPHIGYAITDDDMLYTSMFYSGNPRISTFVLGWNKRIFYSMYMGLSGSIFGSGAQWDKSIGYEIGVAKHLFTWLQVMPKVKFIETWNDSQSDFHFSTGLTFTIKLSKTTLQ